MRATFWTLVTGLALAAAMALPARADDDFHRLEATGSVAEVMNRLVEAVEGAGALVFARVDHAGGAAQVGMDLRPMELLIFGNPRIGTPALQAAPLAGLMLPLRVLAYEDEDGKVWLAWQDPGEMLDEAGGDDDAAYVAPIASALDKLTSAAAGG